MQRGLAIRVATAAAVVVLTVPASAQDNSPLAGVWTLNRSMSESPHEFGFNINPVPSTAGPSAGSNGGGGRGRRGSGGGYRGATGSFSAPPESYDDARRVQWLTAEARNPPARLMVVDTPAAVTMTNELGQSRTLHPNGRQETIDIEGVPALVTTRRDGDRLVVLYHAEQNRDVQYTYSRAAGSPQLIVDVQFLEHGAGDKARRVYDSGIATDTAASAASASSPARPSSSTSAVDARPNAELRGLRNLGILVEDLSTQAIACGLNHHAIETALSKRLTDGGFVVRTNSDEDTYVYVNVMTTRLSDGACASRYDAFLYTHASANLTYRDQPVLVQVSLMHRGGIGTSAPSVHATAVVRGLESYIDLFVTQIRDANK